MKSVKTFIIVLILGMFCVVSCQTEKIPKEIISEKKMIELLTEIHTMDAYFAISNNYKYDSVYDKIGGAYQMIFKKYGITSDEFAKSIEYYTEHPQKFRSIYEKVILQLD